MKYCKYCDNLIPEYRMRCKECNKKFHVKRANARYFLLKESRDSGDITYITGRITNNTRRIRDLNKEILILSNQNELLKTRRTMIRETLNDKKRHWAKVKQGVVENIS